MRTTIATYTTRELTGWDPSMSYLAPASAKRVDIPEGTAVVASPYPGVGRLFEVVTAEGAHAYAWDFQLDGAPA